MTTTVDQYGNIVEDTSQNTNTNMGGSDIYNTGNTGGVNDTLYENNGSSSDTSGNVVDKSYVGGKDLSGLDLNGIKKWVSNNAGLLGLAGAAAGLMTNNSPRFGKTGYQGSIPTLLASRNMITAPPSDRRAGAGGVNYGGDVTYTRAPAGTDPWVNLHGDSAFIAPPGGSANILKGTGGNDPQSMANKIGFNLPQGWSGFTPDQKIAWFNQNKVSVDQLHAAGVPQSDIDFMLTHGYGATKPTTNTSIDALAEAQKVAQKQADTVGLKLPSDWSSYDAKKKIDWYNANKVTPDQLTTAGVDQGTLDWMKQHGYGSTAPAQSAGLASALQQGMTQQQYLNNIENWLQSHSTATDQDVANQMKQYGISAEDLASAHPAFKLEEVKQKLHNLGVEGYAMGGMAEGRYLQGETDGMADKIPAKIGEEQPAALSHGEFVVPADVVSHLGNGNSDAGAKKLYQMMDKIRMARTGNKKQGKRINPDKFMPGGLAQAYATGGSVKKFTDGGTTGTPAANVNAGIAGVESNLSNWAGDYVTNMLGQGQALANMPYQSYMGPLTAGPSALQNKVSQGLQGINFPGILGQSFSSAGAPPAFNPATMQSNLPGGIASEGGNLPGAPGSGVQDSGQAGMPQATTPGIQAPQSNMGGISQPSGIAASYMNPYLQNVLQPQLAELRRQNDITNMNTNAKLTGAGGYGGGRQAIMNAENDRNLLTAQNTAIGQGYANAFDKAQQQFNTEQGQAKTLADMMAGQGATDRGIESEGVAADKAAFEEARANPYKMVQFQQSLLQGLPLNAQSYTGIQQSDLVKAAQGATTVNGLLKNLGLIP